MFQDRTVPWRGVRRVESHCGGYGPVGCQATTILQSEPLYLYATDPIFLDTTSQLLNCMGANANCHSSCLQDTVIYSVRDSINIDILQSFFSTEMNSYSALIWDPVLRDYTKRICNVHYTFTCCVHVYYGQRSHDWKVWATQDLFFSLKPSFISGVV